jgi:hypothetical protein
MRTYRDVDEYKKDVFGEQDSFKLNKTFLKEQPGWTVSVIISFEYPRSAADQNRIREWCDSNLEHRYFSMWTFDYFFESDEDAMLFKLTWSE